ncbi:unnamed protein product, partial [Mesorhabditis belari]|uniref:Rieske domain-containing protein n=1 Tax=Mesorhabditis belari TaxID=2138241 RepID=A0AAF3F1E9_9BILA
MPFCCPPSKGLTAEGKEIGIDDSPVIEQELCSVDELPPGERKEIEVDGRKRKEIEVDGRKLLLVNDKGTIFCVNALCSHYNFPLIKGFVYEGKIRCPLHGACFSLKTGDIEEFPGFDSINSYQIENRNGKLFLKSTEKRLGNDRRTRKAPKVIEKKENPIVVIGGGPSADSLTETLRLLGCTTPIVMITQDEHPPYDRVMLSKNFDVQIDAIRHRLDDFYQERKITVRTKTKVLKIDATTKTIELENGEELKYSKLVIATGGTVRKLTDPGANLKNIYYVREYSDVQGLVESAKDKDVVVIGGSFIGMESASTISKVAKSVTVICATEEPMPAFGRDVGMAFRKYFGLKGVEVKTRARVASLEGDSMGNVIEVRLQNGGHLPAQVVIAGIGVAPSTDFVRKSGNIKLDNQGFILVNADFQTNDHNIYAIGDVCSFPLPYWNRKHVNIQHFQTAQKHGELCAYSLLGKPHPGALVPFFWTVFFMERGSRFVGLADDYDEVYTRGEVNDFDFRKYYIKNDEVVAVCDAGLNPIATIPFAEIFKRGIRVTRDEVERNKNDDWTAYLEAPVVAGKN